MEAILDLEDMVKIMRNLGAIDKACQDLSEVSKSIQKDAVDLNNRLLEKKVCSMDAIVFQINQSRMIISRTLGTWS